MLDNKMFSEIKPETYNSIGSIHKYWGRKPYNVISELINYFTDAEDTVLDPFCGSGVVLTQALMSNRKAIGVDLNPISVLLTKVSCTPFDIKIFKSTAEWVIDQTRLEVRGTYCDSYICVCGHKTEMVSAVRSKDNQVKYLKLRCSNCGVVEKEITKTDIKITVIEDNFEIRNWTPVGDLIPNSRINAKPGTKISDLYTRRNLRVLSILFKYINEVKDQSIKDALLVTFTANLPNSSRLTPIIKQRGRMAPGAWMTGFYVGDEFLEQNVFQYFENRVQKTIKAQKELQESEALSKSVQILNQSSESLEPIPDESVDFIFTDPPYGDAVPYLEQSLLYNSWLNKNPDYESEVVISDSKVRNKNDSDYFMRISSCFHEMHRVLKKNKMLIVTFHNMDSDAWHRFVNSIVEAGFKLDNVFPLYQKTSTPRQLNRAKSIKCDMLLSFKKSKARNRLLNEENVSKILKNEFKSLKKKNFTTDELITASLIAIYRAGLPMEKVNLLEYIESNFIPSEASWVRVDLN